MKVAALVVLLIGASSTQIDLGPLIPMLVGGGIASLVAAYAVFRKVPIQLAKTKQEMEDTAAKNKQELQDTAAKNKQELEASMVETSQTLVSTLREEMLRRAAETAEAEAAEAKARADLKAAHAELAQALADASKERHDLRNEIAARDARIAFLEREVGSLKAAFNAKQFGRRASDRDES